MANTFYPKGAQKILGAAINFSADTIKVAAVSSGYTYSTAHEFLSDLGTIVGTTQTLTSKSITDGVFDAADIALGALAAGSTIKALAVFKDTGSASKSPLIAYFDDVMGLPFTTNGGEVSFPWSNGPYKIISLL